MSMDLQVFDYEDNRVRTVQRDGEPWWVLKDVCAALRLTTPTRIAERLDADDVSQAQIIDAMGRKQKMVIISEAGLFSVILRSDKPEARRSGDPQGGNPGAGGGNNHGD